MKVIFRKFKKYPDSVIAIFIEMGYPKYTAQPHLYMSYMHVGQHGECDYNHLLNITRKASKKEYSDLLTELESIGYNDLKIIERMSR